MEKNLPAILRKRRLANALRFIGGGLRWRSSAAREQARIAVKEAAMDGGLTYGAWILNGVDGKSRVCLVSAMLQSIGHLKYATMQETRERLLNERFITHSGDVLYVDDTLADAYDSSVECAMVEAGVERFDESQHQDLLQAAALRVIDAIPVKGE